MSGNGNAEGRSPRCVALVGPHPSGKTNLFEAILLRTGAAHEAADMRKTVGDTSAESKSHGMSVEMNVANFDFLGDKFTLLDCPGSVEFQYDGMGAIAACDAAIVVCEADEKKLHALQIVLKSLETAGVPHFLFINKIDKVGLDKVGQGIGEILTMMQPASRLPLLLRQIPIWENGVVSGFVDLALERAFVYREHAPSEVIAIPNDLGAIRGRSALFHAREARRL